MMGEEDMIDLRFWRRCFICHSNKNVEWVRYCSWGDCYKEYYHDDCIKEVLCNPEKYSNRIIRQAQSVVELKEEIREYRKRNIKKAKEICAKMWSDME